MTRSCYRHSAVVETELPYQLMIHFTSSWDDGAVTDLRLADLLHKYDQQATFYIPLNNIENRAVMRPDQMLDLSDHFEIGGHTMNHKYLTTITDKEAVYEITESKKALEDIISDTIDGFCFPGGKFHNRHLDFVKKAGFSYSRTVNQFRYRSVETPMNTALQAYNHSKFTHVKHLLKRRYVKELFQNAGYIIRHRHWNKMLLDMIQDCLKNSSEENYYIHLWGHSWEVEENAGWRQLEDFFKGVSGLGVKSVRNKEMNDLAIAGGEHRQP